VQTDHVPIEQLSALLDGELEATEQATVESHLSTCEVCQAELESLRSTVMRLSALPTLAPPRSFALPAVAPTPVVTRSLWQRPELLRAFAGMAAALMLVVVAADALRPPAASLTSATAARQLSAPGAAPAEAPAAALAPAAPAADAFQPRTESAPASGNAGAAAPQQRAAVPQAAAPAPAPERPASATGTDPSVPALRGSPDEVRAFSVTQPASGPGPAQIAAGFLGLVAVALFLVSFFVRRA
jgi:hypothetical protein